jgi:hypothetical protein
MLKKFAEQINEEEVKTEEAISEDLEAVQDSEDMAEEVVAETSEETVAEEAVAEEEVVAEEVSDEDATEELDEAKKSVKSEEDDAEDDDDDEDGDDDDDDDDEEEEAAEGKKLYASKDKEKKMKEEVELTVDVAEDVDALLSGSDAELSEEFKEKAQTIFEAAVKAKVAEQLDAINEAAQADFDAKLEEARGELAEKVDGYLNYVVEEWVKENALAIERGIRTEIAEEFMNGLKNLFVENYIDVPEEKADLVDELATKSDDLEAKLNEEFEKNVAMKKELDAIKAENALTEAVVGLTDTQADKVKALAEGVEFETIDQYREKLETIKESYFPKVRATGAEKEDSVDAPQAESLSESMSVYARTLSSMKK